MKKPPPHKPMKAKPNLQQLTVSTKQTITKLQSKEEEQLTEQIEQRKLSFASAWKDFWSFAGPIITVVGIAAALWPSINISTGANLDPDQEFQTQFVVTNTGKVPVYDIKFSCTLIGLPMYLGSLKVDPETLPPIAQLNPGEPASRGCFARSLDLNGPMLKVQAYFRWPLINREASTTAYFAVRRGSKGAVLVPEAAPSPEPPGGIQIGYSP